MEDFTTFKGKMKALRLDMKDLVTTSMALRKEYNIAQELVNFGKFPDGSQGNDEAVKVCLKELGMKLLMLTDCLETCKLQIKNARENDAIGS